MKKTQVLLLVTAVLFIAGITLPEIFKDYLYGPSFHDVVYTPAETVPEHEKSILKVVGKFLEVTSFDGNPVSWDWKSRVGIPAGNHTMTFYFDDDYDPDESYESYTLRMLNRYEPEITFNAAECDIYEFTVHRDDSSYPYFKAEIEKNGVTSFAVPGEHETLMIFKKTGLFDLPVYVHIQGENKEEQNEITFYLPRKEEVRQIVPNGTYILYGSKLENGKGGKTVELAAWPGEIAIEVTGPHPFTQPGIRVKK